MSNMKIIMIRHGETEWNARHKVLGRTDIPLNANGRAQAENTAAELREHEIADIYCSPLKRTVETAEIISAATGARVISRPVLIEHDYGIYEGTEWTGRAFQQAKRDFVARFPQGESYLDVAARVYPFIKELQDSYDGAVAVVTHGGVCRIMVSYFEDMSNEEFASHMMDNCGYRIFTL